MDRKIKQALENLKKKFVGLDDTIDQIGQTITPWILTPEIITRPVVISLWGMTGTGKSSLVRELMTELGYIKSTMFFDCGDCTDENKSVVANICDTFGLKDVNYGDDGVVDTSFTHPNPVLVFDEFQYAKTIDEKGEEVINSSLRPIWYLIDSGIVDINDEYSWAGSRLVGLLKKLSSLSNVYPDMKVVKGKITDPHSIDIYKSITGEESYSDEEDEKRPITVLVGDIFKIFIGSLNKFEEGLGYKFVDEYLKSTMTIKDLVEWGEKAKENLCIPKTLDFSNALVFVVGNLDEAYLNSDDTSPDMDADMFYNITSRVNIGQIKEALKCRFRPEQVARLGNNMILYPTLKSSDFKKVIDLEVNNTLERFKESWKGELRVTERFKDLLYSEGVYPTQGVRPLFSTINSYLYPLLSRIMTEFKEGDEVTIDVETDDFKVDEVDLEVTSLNNTIRTTKKLQLGELRNPKNRKKRYICSVHEIGHAIVFSYLTGLIPERIVSVSTDGGGFCITYNKDEEKEISSRKNIDNEVMVSLGGYMAEELIYGERPDLCLLGSMSDLRTAWVYFSEAVYNLGYFAPIFYTSKEVDGGMPYGIPNGVIAEDSMVRYFDGKEFHPDKVTIKDAIDRRMNDYTKEVRLILEANIELLKKAALLLGDKGIMLGGEFEKLIEDNKDKYNRSLTLHKMREMKETLNPEYYWKKLL